MRAIRQSGSMSGVENGSMVQLMRHRQTKESVTDRLNLNHRVTPRLHRCGFGGISRFSGVNLNKNTEVVPVVRKMK